MSGPWMNYEAQRFLASILDRMKSAVVFEWGAGRSTEFFAVHLNVASLLTVEHDGKWVPEICGAVLMIPVPSMEYIKAVRRAQCQYDLILVDGRRRVECMMEAIPKVKPGGWLVLDDSQRDRYRKAVLAVPEGWTRVTIHGPGDGGTWRTTFWNRPS